MVNPASDLFEQHPDWAIAQRHREPILGRNQRVLDLSRPEVREFVFRRLVVEAQVAHVALARGAFACFEPAQLCGREAGALLRLQ